MNYGYFSTKHGDYLTRNNTLTKNVKEAILIQEELVGERISRFKFCMKDEKVVDNYLASKDDDIYLTNKKDDATLFVKQPTYSHGIIHYITLKGKCLSISGKLRCSKLPENNELPPDFTNLILTYIHPEKVSLSNFREDGIIFWKHHYWGDNLFETIKEKIFANDTDQIYFFFHNFILQSCISTSLKGMLEKIFTKGYILTNYFFEKTLYQDIHSPSVSELSEVRVIIALDDLILSYKPQSFLSYDTFPEEAINIPKGNIVLLHPSLWYRIIAPSNYLIVNYSSL